MIPAGNAGSEEVLNSVNSRMNMDDSDPDACSEASALVQAEAAPKTIDVTVADLRKQLKDHGRRLRELELNLRGTQLAPRCPFPNQTFRARTSLQSRSITDGSSPKRKNLERDADTSPSAGDEASRKRISCSTSGGKDEDPYKRMFASAHFNHARMFDQDLLMAIYAKPYKRKRQQAALLTSGILGLLSMPFGPIGMVGGAMLGALLGAVFGALADMRTIKAKLEDSELEKKRLKSLVRWASERHNEDDDVLKLIEMVTLEFKPMSDIATRSKNARKLLKLLDAWIGRKTVTRHLWVYMEQLVVQWRELSREQLLRSMFFLQTLTVMYRHSPRSLDDQEVQFIRRMERLLAHESVKSVMAHAQLPTQDESRVMESMVYADSVRYGKTLPKGIRSPPHPEVEPQAALDLEMEEVALSDDSDEELERAPQRTSTPKSEVAPLPVPVTPGTASPGGSRKMVLKKPFFRNWEDFMDFDDTVKHKMPITWCEFDLLLQKEAEDTKNWDLCIERKDLRIAKIMTGPGMICLRAWATLPNVDVHTAFKLFYNLEERSKWDKTFSAISLVDSGIQGSDVVYYLVKIPTVTPRDFLQYRRVRLEEDGAISIVLRSADHANMPEDSRYIRVESKISGYVLRQDHEAGKPVLRMFLMSCSDVKGMIPKWIVNYMAPKKPIEWLEALRKAALEYQATHQGTTEEVKGILCKCTMTNPFDYENEDESGGSSPLRGVAADKALRLPGISSDLPSRSEELVATTY